MNGDHANLVEKMVEQGEELAKKKKLGPYKMGFHCVPSLAQVKRP
jgi:hypothetical protein